MKKLAIAIASLAFVGFAAFAGSAKPVLAEGEVVETTYAATVDCKVYAEEGVEDADNERGDVWFSASEGNVGDAITAIVRGNPALDLNETTAKVLKYAVTEAKWNGEDVLPIEEGGTEYELILIEGENLFEVTFGGTVQVIAGDLLQIDWWKLFTVDNLLKVVEWIIFGGFGLGFFITLLKNKKIKSKTLNEVNDSLVKNSNTTITALWDKMVEEKLKPILENVGLQNNAMVKQMNTVTRCFLLAQEDTPEARLAITKELQDMEVVDKQLTAEVQAMINSAIAAAEAKKAEQAKAIEEVKEAIAEIKEEASEPVAEEPKEEPRDLTGLI